MGDKKGQKPQRKNFNRNEPVIKDPRFAHVHQDPRFRRPKKSDSKVTIDSRFKDMLTSEEFAGTPKVDKYGRKVQQKTADELKRFYHIEDDEESESEEEKTLEELEKELAEDEENLRDEISENEEEDDDLDAKAVGKQVYDPMRGKGIIGSSDESSTDEEEDEEEEEQEEETKVPEGEPTRRIAAVNMDWDNIKAVDLLKVLNGFKPSASVIKSVSIYPSQFGKERMQREDIEGPPKEIFDVDPEKLTEEDEGEEFDQEALRKYQLDRLKYYYAVIECDSVATAKALYEACDGTEYESSANFFDLRYIPDDMTFDDEPREVATIAPENYKPSIFSTQALQHTKVKLTWDEDDNERMQITRRNFTESDLQELDFSAYIASSDEESDYDEEDVNALREKYRKLLEESDGNAYDGHDHQEEGDMEISFTPGLSEAAAAAVEKKNEPEEKEETTIEKYQRKQREKRQARKEKRKAAKNEEQESESEVDEDDPYFKEALEEMEQEVPSSKDKSNKVNDKKKNRKSKNKLSKEELEEQERQKADLELLMDDADGKGDGFNMADVIKKEKAEARKGKKNKRKAAEALDGAQEDFEINVEDPRFAAMHESHHFAIDPTNPQFRKTKSMQKIMETRQKKLRQSKLVEEDSWKK